MSSGTTDPNDERREFAARYASLQSTAAFAQSFGERHAVPRDTALKVALIVEELLSNTIEHGFGGECDELVAISLRASGSELVLTYEDGAPPFDPFASASRRSAAIEGPTEARGVGGLGLRLVGGLPAGAHYAHENGRNRLLITFRLDDSLPQ